MKKLFICGILAIVMTVCMLPATALAAAQALLPASFTATDGTTTKLGDYVLIVNESLTNSQQIGTISYDDTNPFGSTNGMKALSINEDLYQQSPMDDQPGTTNSLDDTTPVTSSDTIQGLSENEDASDDFSIKNFTLNTQAVTKTYTIGETKEWVYPLAKRTFTVRGIGDHCVIWMDAAADGKYTTESLSIAIASIINTYENYSYPALQILGADTKMNYVDGSGKLSIFIQGASTVPYFSYTDLASPNSTTGIHISASTAPTDFSSYALAMAHEGQHALNASTQNFMSWINEGLSTAIMHDLSYKMKNYQYDYISLPWLQQCVQDIKVKSGAGLAHVLATGNSYIDYSIPYLYLRYLSDQVNGGYKYDSDFFSRLYCVDASASGLTEINRDAYIIEQVLKQYDCFKNPDGSHWSFQQSFANFRIAAFKQDTTGIYGFYGDTTVTDNIRGIGGAALYFNAAEKSKKIEPTGAIIVKTRNGSFDLPADAGDDIKFIPFDVAGQLPANKLNTWFAGGEITSTIYKDRPITFDNLRVVWLHTDGAYGPVYKGLSELYTDPAKYRLVAYSPTDTYLQTPIPYTLGALPTNIPDGSQLWICYPYQGYFPLVYLGKAIVRDSYIEPQDFFTVVDADHSLLTFNNNDNFQWLGSTNTSPTYVMSDFKGQTGDTSFTATITIPKNATAKLRFDWTTNCSGYYAQMAFYINGELKKSITGDWFGPGTNNFWNYPDGMTNSFDLSGGSTGTKYTFRWEYSQSYSDPGYPDAGYVRNIVITDLSLPTLRSITAPTAITGLANGTAKTAADLGLPATVTMVTGGGNVSASVNWDVASSSYNAATKTQQTFTVNGTVTLPNGVVNTNNVALTTSISVTINSDGTIDECFIATAAFGSKFTWPVALLRHFRDQYLMTNAMGTIFVNFYYQHSPPIASFIAGSESLKMLVRAMLAPIIGFVYLMYHPLLGETMLMVLIMLFVYRGRQRRRFVQG